MADGLTDKQQQVLDFIKRNADQKGYPPTVREIGLHMGISSTNAVAQHLEALEKKGYIERVNTARGITVKKKRK